MISSDFSFLTGMALSNLQYILWVCHRQKFLRKIAGLGTFILFIPVGLVLTELFIWYSTEQVGLPYLASKIFYAALGNSWNFSGRPLVLF